MKTLPTKFSDLITTAYADAKQILRTEGYVLNMDQWHQYNSNNRNDDACHVCIAGSVMAKTLGAPRTKDLTPSDMPEAVRGKLEALNMFRLCFFYSALESFYSEEVADKHADRLQEICFESTNPPHLYSSNITYEDLEAFFNHPMIINFRRYLVDNGL